jgi:glycosyltransferase involved in cell wall biosynthesis
VLSSSSAFAQHVRVPAGAVHVAYCHTPPRFLWEPEEYFSGRRLARTVMSPALSLARAADARAARRVDLFLANSAFTAERIRRFYGREARVLAPPIETDAFAPTPERSGRFLVASRLKRHKRVDLAIEAANRTRFGLDVIGEGPEERRLRAAAGPTVRFLGRLPDADVRAAMARAAGLVVPGIEDFGMTMAEVQAAGRPPVAFARGGALEIVTDGATGFLVHEQTADAFADALVRAVATPLDAPSETAAIRASARRFDAAGFDAAIREIVAGAAHR